MEPSKVCYGLIKKYEGYHTKLANGDCKAYECPASGKGGNPRFFTIGYGTIKYPDGTKVKSDDVRTEAQAASYLAHGVTKICVPAIERFVKVPLTQGQFDALVSFIYNCGAGAFEGSTLLQLLNLKKYVEAADQFSRWNKGGGVVLPGLITRRKEESDLFLTGVVTEPSYPVLKRGDMGDAVQNMQEMIIKLTYTGVEADGVFGTYTEDAVKRFQTNMKLVVDGICGPATWEVLIKRTTGVPPTEDKWSGLNGNYVVVTRTYTKNGAGLEVLKATVYQAGKAIGSIPMVSGQSYAQDFRKGKASASGSMEPAPELKEGYALHDISWAGDKDNWNVVHSSALGPWTIWLEEDQSDCYRREICFHQDWNANVAPGSAGCICASTVSSGKEFIALLRKADPKKCFVDWGLGYVKKEL